MRITKVSAACGSRSRPGMLVVELILVLPLLLITLLGTCEFALLLVARAELVSACREGARVASHGGGDREAIRAEVQETVHRVLGKGNLSRCAKVEICWHKEELRHPPATDPNHPQAEDPTHPHFGRDRVEVVVHVPAGRVVPNFLAWAGFSIASRELWSATVMNLE
jgi:hypothetical protein